jgi:tetratricopeptide (TPR) repeat protein
MTLDQMIDAANEATARAEFAKAYALWDKVQQEMAREHPQINLPRMNVALQTALCEARLGRVGVAIDTAEGAAEYFDELGLGDDNVLHALFVLTDCAMAGGDLKRAKEASDRAMKLLQKHDYDSPRSLCTALQWRSKLAVLMKDPQLSDEAIAYGLAELAEMRKQGFDDQEMSFQEAQLFEQRGVARGSFDLLDDAVHDLEKAIALYYEAWGEGDETADEAAEALREIRARLGPNGKKT